MTPYFSIVLLFYCNVLPHFKFSNDAWKTVLNTVLRYWHCFFMYIRKPPQIELAHCCIRSSKILDSTPFGHSLPVFILDRYVVFFRGKHLTISVIR